jgi:hypothetical protein
MAGPARDDGGVKLRAATRATGTARWPGPGTAVVSLLAGIVLAGCASGAPAGGTGAGPRAQPSGSASASSSPGTTVAGSPPSSSNGPDGTASPVAGGTGSGSGCAPWPAGSTRTALLITRASNGQRYCVRTGETVRVSQSGTLSLTAGSEPPRLMGTALVPAPVRPGQAVRSSAASYLAVRAGVAVLTVVRLPCRSIRPQASPAGAPQGMGSLGSTAGTSANAEELAYTGGAPVGAQCQLVQMLRVTIVVT